MIDCVNMDAISSCLFGTRPSTMGTKTTKAHRKTRLIILQSVCSLRHTKLKTVILNLLIIAEQPAARPNPTGLRNVAYSLDEPPKYEDIELTHSNLPPAYGEIETVTDKIH